MPRAIARQVAYWVSCLPRARGPIRIPRIHLFELEDYAWFPAIIRDLCTDYLHFIETGFALHRPVTPLLSEGLRRTAVNRVIDLCAGGGGPVPELQRELAAEGVHVSFTLTDRYPNLTAFQQVAARTERITFVTSAVDAKNVPPELIGFRTLFNSFHHFAPAEGLAVLKNAVKARQAIGIFEIPERSWRVILSMVFLTPWVVLFATPFIRPFRWARLFWTYIIPLVPLTCWWDGIVSQLRAYTPEELQGLAEAAGAEAYLWRAGRVPISTMPGNLTFLIGYPKNGSATLVE